MLKKKAPKNIADQVKALTNQEVVWVWLCPECYPEKIKDFLPHKKVKWNGSSYLGE